jgi:hypothetical protein
MSREIKSQPPVPEYPALPGLEIRNGDQEQASFAQNTRRAPQLVRRMRDMLE